MIMQFVGPSHFTRPWSHYLRRQIPVLATRRRRAWWLAS